MATRKRPERITFEFDRSPFFRVVHSNGVWGGITPRQELSISFFSERWPTPRRVTHTLTEGGLGPETKRDGSSNILRECEVEVLMSMEDAVVLHGWIGEKIEQWRKIGLGLPDEDTRGAP